jgi:glycosyltransferase involved in cell wall biosynthesis
MRILMPTHPCTNTGYPKTEGKVSGGLETAFEKIVQALIQIGHEVTLYTPLNYQVSDPRVSQVEGSFLSKAEGGITRWKQWTQGWLDLSGDYDRVVLNDCLLYLSEETIGQLRDVSPKVRMIYHLYDDQVDGSFLGKQVQILEEVRKHGGRVFAVSPTIRDYLSKKYPSGILSGNPHFSTSLTKDISELSFEKFQVGVCEEYSLPLGSNGDFVFLGRGVKEKNMALALEAHRKSGTDRKIVVITTSPNAKSSDEYFEKTLSKFPESEKVKWKIGVPREEVLRCLANSSTLIFPSKRESFGLVPLEASSLGMNIIHHDTRAGCYTDQDTYCSKCSVSDFAGAISSSVVPDEESKKKRRGWTLERFSKSSFLRGVEKMVG